VTGSPAELLLTLVASAAAAAAVTLAVPGDRRPRWPQPRTPAAPAPGREDSPALRVVGTVSVAAGVLFFVGGLAGGVAAVVAATGCWWATGRMEPPSIRRRRERLAASLPHAVDLLAAALTVGLSPEAALEQVEQVVDRPLADELSELTSRLRMGVDPVTVWRDVARHPQLGGLGRAVLRAVDSGASVADAMLRLAQDQRRRSHAEVEGRARAVGVKAALPLGVCLLPAFVLVGVVPLVAGSISVLVGS
jgi:Flp pilus assembly protein TadB